MTKHVNISQTRRIITVAEGVTILEAALYDGIAYPTGHRRGRSAGLYRGSICSAHVPGRSQPGLFDGKRASDRALEFHIRRVPGGAATQHIHARLKLGDPVLLEGPFGSSYLREQHTGPMLCVAGGSGLAPIKGIVEAAIARGMKQSIHVYFGARSVRDLYLVEHFEGLAQQHPNLSFTPVLSDAPFGGRWRSGFVSDAVAKDLQDLDGWKAYVAGPLPMVEAVLQIGTARELRLEDLHADVFFTPEEASARG